MQGGAAHRASHARVYSSEVFTMYLCGVLKNTAYSEEKRS